MTRNLILFAAALGALGCQPRPNDRAPAPEPVAAEVPRPDPGVALTGNVFDGVTNTAVPRAEVCLVAADTSCRRTGPQGEFELPPLPLDSIAMLEIVAPGYEPTLYPLIVRSGAQARAVKVMPLGHWKDLATRAGVREDGTKGNIRFVASEWMATHLEPMNGLQYVPKDPEAVEIVWYYGKHGETGRRGEAIGFNSQPGLWSYQMVVDGAELLCAARFGWNTSEDQVVIPVVAGYTTNVEHVCMVIPDAA
jgi:hypothetical protein